jgi:hypothetical protein
MKKICALLLFAFVIVGCSTKDKYDINRFYNKKEQDQIITSIITYIFSAPPYAKMEDRFDPKYKSHYSSLTSKFKMVKYFVADDSTHFFYLIRPSSVSTERRAVGGHFKIDKGFNLINFKEEFVTTVQSEKELTEKFGFLFDEMVKGNIDKYTLMKTYVQWPNDASYYDTISYEWKLKPGL